MTYYELKKILPTKRFVVVLAVLAVLLSVVLYAIIQENNCVDENGERFTGFAAIAKVREDKKEWAGELTEEQLRRIIENHIRISQTPQAQSDDYRQNNIAYGWERGYSDVRSLMAFAYSGFNDYNYYAIDTLRPEDAANFYSNRIKSLEEWLNTDAKNQFTEKEREYLLNNYKTLKTPFYYDYQGGWKSLLEYAPAVNMIVTFVLCFLCAGIFASEFQQKSSAVLYASCYGRDRAVAAKIKAGLILVSVLYWAVMLLYTALVLTILGADGAHCPIQAYFTNWKSLYHITNLQEYILTAAGGYIGCLFMALLTMLVSAKINSAVLAVIVPFVLIFLPAFLGDISLPVFTRVMGLMPDQLLQINQAVKLFSIYELGGHITLAVPILLTLYAALSVLLIRIIYSTYRKKQVY